MINVTSNNKRTKFFVKKYGETEGITPIMLGTAYTNLPDVSLWTGPICDDVGYSQHGGECWSDTTQQILFFADGLRELTQEYFYKTPLSEIEKALDNLGDISSEQKEKVKAYAKAAQRRFINHYNYLKTKNEKFDVCVPKPPLKRQQSIIYGSNTAYSIVDYGAGGNFDIIYSVLYPILKISVNRDFSFRQLFDVPTVKFQTALGVVHNRINFETKINLSDTNVGIFFRGLMFPCIIEKSKESPPSLVGASEGLPGHSFGMYSCNGIQHFYDDNYGLIKTEIPLTEISKLSSILVIMSASSGDLVFFIKDDNIIFNSKKVDKIIYYGVKFVDSDIVSMYNPGTEKYVEFAPGGIEKLSEFEDVKIYLYILQGASVLSFPAPSNVVKSSRRTRRRVRRASTRKRRHS